MNNIPLVPIPIRYTPNGNPQIPLNGGTQVPQMQPIPNPNGTPQIPLNNGGTQVPQMQPFPAQLANSDRFFSDPRDYITKKPAPSVVTGVGSVKEQYGIRRNQFRQLRNIKQPNYSDMDNSNSAGQLYSFPSIQQQSSGQSNQSNSYGDVLREVNSLNYTRSYQDPIIVPDYYTKLTIPGRFSSTKAANISNYLNRGDNVAGGDWSRGQYWKTGGYNALERGTPETLNFDYLPQHSGMLRKLLQDQYKSKRSSLVQKNSLFQPVKALLPEGATLAQFIRNKDFWNANKEKLPSGFAYNETKGQLIYQPQGTIKSVVGPVTYKTAPTKQQIKLKQQYLNKTYVSPTTFEGDLAPALRSMADSCQALGFNPHFMRPTPKSRAIFIGSFVDPFTGNIRTPPKPRQADYNPNVRQSQYQYNALRAIHSWNSWARQIIGVEKLQKMPYSQWKRRTGAKVKNATPIMRRKNQLKSLISRFIANEKIYGIQPSSEDYRTARAIIMNPASTAEQITTVLQTFAAKGATKPVIQKDDFNTNVVKLGKALQYNSAAQFKSAPYAGSQKFFDKLAVVAVDAKTAGKDARLGISNQKNKMLTGIVQQALKEDYSKTNTTNQITGVLKDTNGSLSAPVNMQQNPYYILAADLSQKKPNYFQVWDPEKKKFVVDGNSEQYISQNVKARQLWRNKGIQYGKLVTDPDKDFVYVWGEERPKTIQQAEKRLRQANYPVKIQQNLRNSRASSTVNLTSQAQRQQVQQLLPQVKSQEPGQMFIDYSSQNMSNNPFDPQYNEYLLQSSQQPQAPQQYQFSPQQVAQQNAVASYIAEMQARFKQNQPPAQPPAQAPQQYQFSPQQIAQQNALASYIADMQAKFKAVNPQTQSNAPSFMNKVAAGAAMKGSQRRDELFNRNRGNKQSDMLFARRIRGEQF